MTESKLPNLSLDLSFKIIKLCESIKCHYSLTNQLERSGTSIGANIHEANYAQSKNDFISKLQIALKECYETEYWLELFVKSELLDKKGGLSSTHVDIRSTTSMYSFLFTVVKSSHVLKFFTRIPSAEF